MKKGFQLLSKQTVLVGLILVLAFTLRIPFWGEPLDYDEGLYAFWASSSQENQFSFSSPFLKLPGIIFTYRFLDNLFPGKIVSFRIAAALSSVLATFGIYKLGKRLYSHNMGIFSALIFALFSSQISTDSPANTEFFMIPFTVLAFWLFWLFLQKEKLIWLILSSLNVGVAFFYKQVAVFEAAFLGLWLVVEGVSSKKNGRGKWKSLFIEDFVFLISFLTPLLVSILFFFSKGQLADFWWHSFGSGASYISSAWKGQAWFLRFKETTMFLWGNFWPFWSMGAGGLIIVFLKRQKESVFLTGWTVFALMGACFNGWFFPHYFVQVIPPVSLLGGLFFAYFFQWLKNQFPLHKVLAEILPMAGFLGIFLLAVRGRLPTYFNYLQMIRGRISRTEYLEKIGFDVTEAGWLPFYEAADYLKTKMKEGDSFFAWSTTPLPYYLNRKRPPNSFVDYYSFLDYQFMLLTYKSWAVDFEANRQQLMKTLTLNPPDYLFVQVTPEQIFDQMILFEKFSSFVALNYRFEKQFGNLLVFKIKEEREPLESKWPIIPLELIKRFSAIVEIEEKNGQTKISFEPMVNPNGVLRQLTTVYPEVIKINFEPIALAFFGRDGADFVGVATQQPSGVIDLHIKVKGVKKPVSFVRVKMGKIAWNNRGYGVNPALRIIQNLEALDLYFEPPQGWQGKTINIYFIYEDGSISSQDITLAGN